MLWQRVVVAWMLAGAFFQVWAAVAGHWRGEGWRKAVARWCRLWPVLGLWPLLLLGVVLNMKGRARQ